MKLYDVLKVKNAMVKSVYRVKKYVIWILIISNFFLFPFLHAFSKFWSGDLFVAAEFTGSIFHIRCPPQSVVAATPLLPELRAPCCSYTRHQCIITVYPTTINNNARKIKQIKFSACYISVAVYHVLAYLGFLREESLLGVFFEEKTGVQCSLLFL